MAKALGVTMCLLSVCGEASNTRRCICEPTTASARRAAPSNAISISTMPSVPIRALTARRPIRPTSPCCRSAWRLNPGRGSTYRGRNSVQRIGTTAYAAAVDVVANSVRNEIGFQELYQLVLATDVTGPAPVVERLKQIALVYP